MAESNQSEIIYPEPRSLDSVYVRVVRNGKSCARSFTDLIEIEQQKYLETLRKDNADFDFIIADKGDDFRGLVDQSDKEFTVVFSSAELERMASDEKYAREKLSTVKTAVEMSDKINEQFGFERAWGTTDNSGTVLTRKYVSNLSEDEYYESLMTKKGASSFLANFIGKSSSNDLDEIEKMIKAKKKEINGLDK